MAYKLLDSAKARWRRINGHELVPLVRAGATFIDGKLQERSDTTVLPLVIGSGKRLFAEGTIPFGQKLSTTWFPPLES